ncbi:glycosyltransferase family 4 protein [Starkeya koreensis]|uniref:Glycosyltransferase family 4 protein n=1 Tax=Ancylobacter koreensis TaxID=266121 RepID=A0ABT0DGK9_9HYPH|nr:glycosyltransferase family 4 protein [Ancylobacter koreensis]MCK0206416.1 glycosyltransferase family 4 protein [Ancylobacter koreensis]
MTASNAPPHGELAAGFPRAVTILTCEFDPFPGGIATYCTRMAQTLDAAGVVVDVICPAYPDLASATDPGSMPGDIFTRRLLGHHSIPAKAVPTMLRTLRGGGADKIVLAADIRSVLFMHVTRRLHGRRYLAMVHGSEAAKFRPGSLLYRLVRGAYFGAERVNYNSQATRAIFHAAFGAPPEERVTYLGVDPGWFEEAPGPFDHPLLAQLPAGAQVVCSVGRIEPRKGHVEAVRALARMRDDMQTGELIYVVAGKPEEPAFAERIEAEARRLGVNAILAGRLSTDDIKRLYRRAACHVLLAQPMPGKVEGFGLVLAEAAAQGCPSVATNEGGIPEVIAGCGALVPAGDTPAAARAIQAYLSDAASRARASAASRERARSFTWQRCADATFRR